MPKDVALSLNSPDDSAILTRHVKGTALGAAGAPGKYCHVGNLGPVKREPGARDSPAVGVESYHQPVYQLCDLGIRSDGQQHAG